MSANGLSFLARGQSAASGMASFAGPSPSRGTLVAGPQAPMESRNVWPAQPLTRREIDVLQLLRGPLPRREIAAELRLSLNTVKSHTRAIYRKLGVSTRRDAISREAPPPVRPDRRASAAEPLTEREIEVL